jgi:hypothetical protein
MVRAADRPHLEDRGVQVRHSSITYLGCTLDGRTITPSGHPASFQAKHLAASGEAMEIRYTAQCHHEALVLGCDHYVLSVFVGTSKWELYEREVDPFFAAEYLEKCAEFWRFVENDVEPPAAPPLAVPAPRRLRSVDMLANNAWAIEAERWLQTRPIAKDHERAAKELKAMVEDDVGLAAGHGVQIKRGRNGSLYITETDND